MTLLKRKKPQTFLFSERPKKKESLPKNSLKETMPKSWLASFPKTVF